MSLLVYNWQGYFQLELLWIDILKWFALFTLRTIFYNTILFFRNA